MSALHVIHSEEPLREEPMRPMTYVEIADDLAERIRKGEYQPGAKLPSYQELAGIYSVHFTTIAKAMALLRRDGLVIGAPGRGVFVVDELPN